MPVAALDLAPEYEQLREQLTEASFVPDGEDSASFSATPWSWDILPSEDWSELRALAQRNFERVSMSTFQRRATLGVVLAWLEGFELNEVSILVGASPKRLVQWLHGEASIPKVKDVRLRQISSVIRALWKVLDPQATERWFKTPVPSLRGLTPLEAFRRNRGAQVERVTMSYLDPAFS